MIDASLEYLAHKRLDISKDSIELMKSVSSELQQDESLKVRGVAFFGSRIKGLSKETSDLDMAVFYDGSNYPEDRYVYDPDKLPDIKKSVEAKTDHEVTIIRKAASLVAGKVPLAESIEKQIDSILTVDISPKNLDYLLEDYKSNAQKDMSASKLSLVSIFLLGVGDGLYQARKYILDKLGNNDTLFSTIMRDLSTVERPQSNTFFPAPRSKAIVPPEYLGYPQTISEARKYFLTRD